MKALYPIALCLLCHVWSAQCQDTELKLVSKNKRPVDYILYVMDTSYVDIQSKENSQHEMVSQKVLKSENGAIAMNSKDFETIKHWRFKIVFKHSATYKVYDVPLEFNGVSPISNILGKKTEYELPRR